MPTPALPVKLAEEFFAEIEKALAEGHFPDGHPDIKNGRTNRSALRIAGTRLGMRSGAIHSRYKAACRALGRQPDWSKWKAPVRSDHKPPDYSRPKGDPKLLTLALLKRKMATLEDVAYATDLSKGQSLDLVEAMIADGINIQREGDRFALERSIAPAFASGDELPTYVSRKDNTFVFGAVADSHLGSKYERLDCLNDIYNRLAAAGVDRVFHCGNWIEGEARFNRTDIAVHGMDAQIAYLVKHYPRRDGIVTYAVTGDDHEGWYAQREGIDIGRHAENQMRNAGRKDWVNLGYMESHVRLVNANTGKEAIMAVVHPGGGSSYADSYVVQKIIESLEGGEKPAVALYGHYHKCLAGEYRNVWWVLVPSTKDQDVFMRKKRIRSVVGGGLIRLEQDPKTGAITGMTPQLWRYFNRGYYNGRWSPSGDAVLPRRYTA